jgi:DNA invertase Pin-like site-specific DNA recombinase
MRWAIYGRISGRQGAKTGADDDDTVSLDTQEDACRAMIAANDPCSVVVEPLVLREVHTGVELYSRPKLTRLREAIRRGEIDAIACYQPKRWSRDPDHAGYLKTELREHGVQIRFCLDDPGTGDAGDIIGYLEHWTGKKEHADISERTHRARAKLVEHGRAWASSKPPYGLLWRYRSVEHPDGRITQDRIGWQVNPTEAAILVGMFDAALGGASLRGIATDLTERRVPSPTGLPTWTDGTVRYLLRQRVYTGDAYGLRHVRDKTAPHVGLRGKSAGRRKFSDRLRPEDEWVKLPDGYAPRLVEPSIFDAVQATLAARTRGGSAPSPTSAQTLMGGGRARCGECGNTLSRLGSKRLALICSGRAGRKCTTAPSIRMATLDDAAKRLALRIYDRPEVIFEQAEALRANDPTEADLKMVSATLADLAQQEAGLLLVASRVSHPAAAATLAAQLERLAEQRAAAERERAGLLERRAGWDRAQRFVDGFMRQARQVRAHLENATHEQWQAAIDALGIEATVYPASAAVRYVLTTEIEGLMTDDVVAAVRADADADDGGLGVCLMRTAPARTTHETHLTLIWSARDLAAFPDPPATTARRAAG